MRCGSNFENVIFLFMLRVEFLSARWYIVPRYMPQNSTEDKSTLIQLMAWCRQWCKTPWRRCDVTVMGWFNISYLIDYIIPYSIYLAFFNQENPLSTSILVYKNFETWLVIGWQVCCQPVRNSQVWKFLFNNLDLKMGVLSNTGHRCRLEPR